MDQSLGTSTYNLSGPWQSTYGTKMLLEEELARNPIKKVYLTISEDTFWVRETSDGVLGDAKILPRLGGLADRVRYMLNSMGVREYPKLYQDMVNRGFTYWTAAILGADTEGVDPMIHVFPLHNVFREDEVTNDDAREDILFNAPQAEDDQFVVPITIE